MLSAYDYDLEYRKSVEHLNADALSRLPYQDSSLGTEGKIYRIGAVREEFPVIAADIAQATLKDPMLSKVYQNTLYGWPETCDDVELKPFHNRRNELSCEQGCVLWRIRVVVPVTLRSQLLSELHWEHPGVCSMKAVARNFMWWPGLDGEIERVVESCSVCQSVRSLPPKMPLHPWKWPIRPFQRFRC